MMTVLRGRIVASHDFWVATSCCEDIELGESFGSSSGYAKIELTTTLKKVRLDDVVLLCGQPAHRPISGSVSADTDLPPGCYIRTTAIKQVVYTLTLTLRKMSRQSACNTVRLLCPYMICSADSALKKAPKVDGQTPGSLT